MNRLKPFLLTLVFVLAVSPLLWAQDAAAPLRWNSPLPSAPAPTPLLEPGESVAPERTPTPVRKPTEAPARPLATPTPVAETPAPPAPTASAQKATPPPAEKKEETKGTPAASSSEPSRRVLQEKPVRAVERPRIPRRPWNDQTENVGVSRPTFDFSKKGDPDLSEVVRRLENKWQAAIRTHDVETVSDLLASDFVGTSSTGRVGSKSTLLAELRRDKNEYKSVEARHMSVRTPGEDTAIVTGITKESGTSKDGKRFATSRRFTDTWVKRNKQWRCIASQTTELSKE